jgi:hypothetical protein
MEFLIGLARLSHSSTCLAREPMLGRKQCNHCQEYYRNRLRRRRAANTASKSPMCSNCFTRDPAPGRKYCEHCRKISIMAHSRGMRATHVTSKSAMCSRCCSRCPAPGRKLCKRCAEMYHSHWERRKAANSEVESPKWHLLFHSISHIWPQAMRNLSAGDKRARPCLPAEEEGRKSRRLPHLFHQNPLAGLRIVCPVPREGICTERRPG